MSEAIQLTGLWKADKLTKNGDPYYSGKTKERIVVEAGSLVCLFKNKSENAKAPPFTITVLPPRDDYQPQARHYGGESNGSANQAPPTSDDDCPF